MSIYKVGDKIICKSFPIYWNQTFLYDEDGNEGPDMKKGETYEVIRADEDSRLNGVGEPINMLQIVGKRGPAFFWSDYFYNIKETRKLKLQKLNEHTK